jgi:lysozyme family protein
MDLSFDAYFEWLIPWEGSSYENDPADPGGATKYGIDQRSHPTVNIRTLTKIQAQRIYWDSYWRTVAAPQLPPKTAWAVMDCAVNCGRAQAVKWLQRFLRITDDGIIGPNTINYAETENDTVMALAVLAQREAHYRALARRGNFAKFLKGWLNRNNDLISKLK